MAINNVQENRIQHREPPDSGWDRCLNHRLSRYVTALIPMGIATAGIFVLLFSLSPSPASALRNLAPNVIVVDTLADDQIINGNCTLREAITAANINFTIDKCPAGGSITDTIAFSVAGTITLTEQLPFIQNAGLLVIDGSSEISLTTNYRDRLFWVNPGARLTLWNLTVYRNGMEYMDYVDTSGGGLYNNSGIVTINRVVFTDNTGWMYSGGAIFNKGTMTITHSVFQENWSWTEGAGIDNEGELFVSESIFWGNSTTESYGGAIGSGGNLEVQRSTFAENKAAYGGAIGNYGIALIANSTFSRNSSWGTAYASDFAGAIFNNGKAQIDYSTFVGNPDYEEPIINNDDEGLLTLSNSILTRDPPYTNCLGTIIDGGFNIDLQDTCSLDPANGSLVNTDPLLGALQNNGGPTFTYAPQAGSPAIDAADPLGCPKHDQRGVPRPYDGDGDSEARCDIGAYEIVPPGNPRSTQTDITSITPKPSLINQWLTINYQVSSAFGVPTGTVTVTIEGHDTSCSGSLSDGLGSCPLMISEHGTYTLTAAYGGKGDYLPSTGNRVHLINTYAAFLPLISQEYPIPLEVVWSGIRPDQYGIYEMIGQVRNVSGSPLYEVTLTAVLYDQVGGIVGVTGGTTALPMILPNENMPFEFEIGYQAPNSYLLTPHWLYDTYPLDYHPVSVISQETSGACPNLIIHGEIRNDQLVELTGINVIVEPGGAGDFYAVATLGQNALLPGETTTYTQTQNHVAPPCPAVFTIRGQGYWIR